MFSDSSANARPGVWGRSTRTVLIAAIITRAVSAPGQTAGISVFVDHLIADLDLTRSNVATAYLIGTSFGAISMPAAGRLLDRRGFRWATMWFGAAFGVVLIAMSAVTGFVTIAVGFALTRMLGQGTLSLIASTSVAVWFDRNRGAALGVLSAVGGGLMSLMPLVFTALIGQVGWRATWIVLGLAVMGIMIPLGRRVVPDRPVAVVVASAVESVPGLHAGIELPLQDREVRGVTRALRSPAFWVVVLTVALAGAYATALMFHQIAILGSRGLTEAQAAANFLPQTAATAAAALIVGRLADRFEPRWLLAGATLALGLAGLNVLTVHSPMTAALYGAGIGACGGAILTVEGAALPRWFGTGHLGELRGVVLAAGVAGSAVGPVILSLAYDLTGTYSAGVLLFSSAAALLGVTAAITRAPADHNVG